jgi:hypothetical protein
MSGRHLFLSSFLLQLKIPGYGEGPMMPPPGFGMGEDKKDRFDPWPIKNVPRHFFRRRALGHLRRRARIPLGRFEVSYGVEGVIAGNPRLRAPYHDVSRIRRSRFSARLNRIFEVVGRRLFVASGLTGLMTSFLLAGVIPRSVNLKRASGG